MNRVLILLVLLVLIPGAAFSQLGLKFGIGANVTFPAADLSDAVATGFGGTAMVKFGLIPLIDLTGGVEYIKFTSKDIPAGTATAESEGNAWGYFVGGRVNIIPPLLYGGLELGGYSFNSEVTIPSLPTTEGSNTEFFYAPMVGTQLGPIDANLRYVVAGGSNFVSLRGMFWF
jgi:hypothetical protein